jgi:UDP-N-acetylglucosamine--N-acetylmuramyl-(pentapeptide) pyrophosphoryl-undecaprenol N-acetylglucosamine transferase
LVLSRAGATAIGEFLALKKPMLLVPWPKGPSRGDQVKNADNYVSRGLALVLPQADLTPGSLAQALSRLRENASCLISAMEKAPPPFGNDDILRLIDQLRKKR